MIRPSAMATGPYARSISTLKILRAISSGPIGQDNRPGYGTFTAGGSFQKAVALVSKMARRSASVILAVIIR